MTAYRIAPEPRAILGIAVALLLGVLAGCGGGGYGVPLPGGGGTPATTAEQQHNLDVINQYRAMAGAALLVLDGPLNDYALDGSRQEMADHSPHAHFLSTPCPYVVACGENQGDAYGWPPRSSVNAQVDEILQAMWNEGPGTGTAHAHYNYIIDSRWTRLGAGLLIDDFGRLYFTNDFQ